MRRRVSPAVDGEDEEKGEEKETPVVEDDGGSLEMPDMEGEKKFGRFPAELRRLEESDTEEEGAPLEGEQGDSSGAARGSSEEVPVARKRERMDAQERTGQDAASFGK